VCGPALTPPSTEERATALGVDFVGLVSRAADPFPTHKRDTEKDKDKDGKEEPTADAEAEPTARGRGRGRGGGRQEATDWMPQKRQGQQGAKAIGRYVST
jgi:hypothetical protein